MKISVIVDNPDSWFNSYIPELLGILKKYDDKPRYLSKRSDIKKGDILFILSCDNILRKEELSLNKNNIVIHAGDLPRDRGWSPLTWQVERGKNIIPVTLFEASGEPDSGDYYLKDTIKLGGTELIDELREKLAKKAIQMVETYLTGYPMKAILQKGKPTYNRKRQQRDFELDINRTIDEQFNKMRVADNERYPLYFKIKNISYTLKIYKNRKS